MMARSRTKDSHKICIGAGAAILLMLVFAGIGGAVEGAPVQPVAANSSQGVDNVYVAADYDFNSNDVIGYSACIFSVPLISGDTIEVNITSESPVDFISGDYNFHLNVLFNSGKIDRSQVYEIYAQESLQNSRTYYLNGPINRGSYNLVVRNPSGDYRNIKGHIRVVVHSKYSHSVYDTKPDMDGIAAAKDNARYAYEQEWNFSSEPYGATDCLSSVFLMPGDVVEAIITTERPVDFISGDYMFGLNFLINNGNTKEDNSNLLTVYQSESYSNISTYRLFKQMDRRWFELAVRNPDGTYHNISGHKRIVVYSAYSKQEHVDEFNRIYAKVMSTGADLSGSINPYDTSDPEGKSATAKAEWDAKMRAWRIWKFGYD